MKKDQERKPPVVYEEVSDQDFDFDHELTIGPMVEGGDLNKKPRPKPDQGVKPRKINLVDFGGSSFTVSKPKKKAENSTVLKISEPKNFRHISEERFQALQNRNQIKEDMSGVKNPDLDSDEKDDLFFEVDLHMEEAKKGKAKGRIKFDFDWARKVISGVRSKDTDDLFKNERDRSPGK